MRSSIPVAAGVIACLLALCLPAAAGRIDETLDARLAAAAADERVPVYAVLADRIPARRLLEETAPLDRDARRAHVIGRLKRHAASVQPAVRGVLDRLEAEGRAGRVRSLWMAGAIAFEGTPAAVRRVAALPAVASVHLDARQPEAVDGGAPVPREIPAGTPLQQGLILIRAEAAWDRGVTGTGVVVANIDTGTDYTHPDLENRVWINTPEDINGDGRFTAADRNSVDEDGNGYVDDVLGYDFGNDDPDPQDSFGHGTQTAGQVAGDGTNGLRTGVAPGARIMALKPWSSGSTESWIWEAMQYAVDMGADITTSSLSWKWTFSPQPNYPMWREMTDIELAAGVLHTNSIGNQGGDPSFPIPYNVATPGNCPSAWLHPDQTLRGGVSSAIGCGNVNAFSDIIENRSGRGPSAWEDIQQTHPQYPYEMPFLYQDYPYETLPGAMGLLKPDVSAPGADTTSTVPGGGYGEFGGTSSATPHTAGVAALVLSADPSLDPAGVTTILQLTAIEKGDPGKDIEYGAGRIDALRAVEAALGEFTPSVDSLDATSLPMYQQNTLVLTGEHFVAGTTVEFDGIPAVDVQRNGETELSVTTPVFPVWDVVDVTVRSALGEVTLPDVLEFRGDLVLNSTEIHIGENVNLSMKGTPDARWGFIVNTELSSCVVKGLPFEVCLAGRLGLSKRERTGPTGVDIVLWPVPDDPALVGETLYVQGGIDGNGSLPDRDWKVTQVVSGPVLP